MGLEVIEQVNPDLVFVDIRMPVMDGLQVIEHMNEQKWTHEVIILTGYKDFHYAQTALRCGAVEYLLKPCPEEQVLGVLDQVFQKKFSTRGRKARTDNFSKSRRSAPYS